MTLDPNMLTQPVRLLKLKSSTATDGQVSQSFVFDQLAWCHFKRRSGAAFMAAHQLNGKITHMATMPCVAGFNAREWRAEYKGRTLEIATVVVADEMDAEEMDVTFIEKA